MVKRPNFLITSTRLILPVPSGAQDQAAVGIAVSPDFLENTRAGPQCRARRKNIMAKKKSSASALTPIASVKHKDTRKNIPTEELRDFVVADEQSPKNDGLDECNPTTGEIRPSSTDDIACWFIDTNYNDESFFVRHAYFTGAGEPYEKPKRALRAEVDESAWSALYATRSRPFDRPSTGKIAIKVINHYGDEVLKVCAVG